MRKLVMALVLLVMLVDWGKVDAQAQPTMTIHVKRNTPNGLATLSSGDTVNPGDDLVFEAITNYQVPTLPATATLTLDISRLDPGSGGTSGGWLTGTETTFSAYAINDPFWGQSGPEHIYWWSTVKVGATGTVVFQATYTANGQTVNDQIALDIQTQAQVPPDQRVYLPLVRQ